MDPISSTRERPCVLVCQGLQNDELEGPSDNKITSSFMHRKVRIPDQLG